MASRISHFPLPPLPGRRRRNREEQQDAWIWDSAHVSNLASFLAFFGLEEVAQLPGVWIHLGVHS